MHHLDDTRIAGFRDYDAGMSAASTESLLYEEAWRSERLINVFRALIWSSICGAILALSADQRLNPAVAAGLVYGIVSGVLGLTWLRRRYHWAFPYVATTLDFGVIVVVHETTRAFLLLIDPAQAALQEHAILPSLLVLLTVNALRFSWRVSAFSVLAATLGYFHVLYTFDTPFSVTVIVNTAHIVAVCAVLTAAGLKLKSVLHRQKERDAFARFLPEPIVEQLTADPSALALGGERKEATVLFADIRGFTTISEKMEPEAVIALLNEYFQEMVDEIFEHRGILDKFIGDGIVAVFVDKLGQGDHAGRAVRCARGMLRRLSAINDKRRHRGDEPLAIGIGIHTGKLVAGNIGSERRLEYTHVGDTVNTASRIEGLTKELGEPLLISRATHERLPSDVDCRALGGVAIRGRDQMALYAVS